MKSKKRGIRVQLEKPCTVSLDTMTKTDSGYYCSHCEKHVGDYRFMDDHELAKRMLKQNTSSCGVFRPDQLERTLALPSKPISHFVPAAMLTAGILLAGELNAHDDSHSAIRMGQTAVQDTTHCSGTAISSVNPNSEVNTKIHYRLHGRVLDSATSKPITQAKVHVLSNSFPVDSTGAFEINIDLPIRVEALGIVVSAIGFESKLYEVKALRRSPIVFRLSPMPKVAPSSSDSSNKANSGDSVYSVFGNFHPIFPIKDTSD